MTATKPVKALYKKITTYFQPEKPSPKQASYLTKNPTPTSEAGLLNGAEKSSHTNQTITSWLDALFL